MSDRSSRKRRKPAKPSRHSPNSQSDILSSSTSSELISPDDTPVVPETLKSMQNSSNTPVKSSSATENNLMGTQMDVEDYINDKRAKMSTSSNDPDDLDSRSGSPQDSLDLSIGSRSHITSSQASKTPPIRKQVPVLKSEAVGSNVSTKTQQSSTVGVLPASSPILSPSLVPASSPGAPPDRSILTQYEELKSKAMTSRARRIIANARERNRVHTISSAFEQLRKSIPCYSGNQKLSKLAILKIATSYIRCLSHVATVDPEGTYEPDAAGKDPKLSELVMRCTVNVLSDGKLKRPEGNSSQDRLGASDYEEELD